MSNEKKYTPGPWELIHGPDRRFHDYCIRAKGKNISGTIAEINSRWPHKEQHDEQVANARLIAAAPELLEALDGLSLVIGLTPISGNRDALQEAMNIARTAIAKALGE